jgi:Domain of unknown function (DUF4333)
LVVAMLVGSVALGGCSTERSLDVDLLEANIADQVLVEYPGAVGSVSCPEVAEPAPGDGFECIASLGDEAVVVQVVVGGTVDALTTDASIDARFVAVNEIAALLAATFGDEVGLATAVDCGSPVVVLGPDELIRCAATDPSGVTRFFDVAMGPDNELTLTIR